MQLLVCVRKLPMWQDLPLSPDEEGGGRSPKRSFILADTDQREWNHPYLVSKGSGNVVCGCWERDCDSSPNPKSRNEYTCTFSGDTMHTYDYCRPAHCSPQLLLKHSRVTRHSTAICHIFHWRLSHNIWTLKFFVMNISHFSWAYLSLLKSWFCHPSPSSEERSYMEWLSPTKWLAWTL